jgi:hypothetical protein
MATRWRRRAAQPVQPPQQRGVAGAELVQELLEGGAVAAGAAGGLGYHCGKQMV